MTASTFKITRATTAKAWWDSTKPLSQYDLSDHHPCEWKSDGLNGLTYNVQFLPKLIADTIGKNTSEHIHHSAHLIADWLTRPEAQYDVICLQELFDSSATKIIEAELAKKGYQATERLGGAILGAPTSGGVRIFARKGIIIEDKGGHIYHHKVDYLRRGDAFVDKGLKHATINKNGQRYHVFNTHLQASYNDPSHQNYVEVALAQLLELKKYIAHQKATGMILDTDKIVLCGDFNIPLNATGNNLDEVSKRGDALFKRAEILLGSEFHRIQATSTTEEPGCSFDPKTNTYLAAINETMSANLDLVFSVDTQKQPSAHPSLDKLVHHVQTELSLCVQNRVSGFRNQLSEENQRLIYSTSMALDDFITRKNEHDACNRLLKFSKLLPEHEQIKIEIALTGAILERDIQSPLKLNRILSCLNQCSDNLLNPEEKQCLRQAMQTLRTEKLIHHASIDVPDLERFIKKIKHKPVFDSALNALETKGKELLTRWASSEAASKAALDLHASLSHAADQYFKLKGTTEQEFKTACNDALNASLPELKKQRGLWGVVGTFLIQIGETFNWPSWIKQGKTMHSAATGSVKIIGLFAKKIQSIEESPHEEDIHYNKPEP